VEIRIRGLLIGGVNNGYKFGEDALYLTNKRTNK
jgi:hypothetical protein